MSDIEKLAKEYGLTQWAHGEEYVSKSLVDFAEAYAEQQPLKRLSDEQIFKIKHEHWYNRENMINAIMNEMERINRE